MGFFSNLFGGKSQEERERDAIFEKVDRFLNDDRTQMLAIPEMLRCMYDSTHVDQLVDGVGAFGRDARNPIPCNGPLGEITYLSKLFIPSDNGPICVTFHRRGSQKVNGRNVDVYEIISYDGLLYDVLYMDMYHTTKSTRYPAGYRMEKCCSGFRGINNNNPEFPHNQYQRVIDCAKGVLGFSAFDTQLKKWMKNKQLRRLHFAGRLGL